MYGSFKDEETIIFQEGMSWDYKTHLWEGLTEVKSQVLDPLTHPTLYKMWHCVGQWKQTEITVHPLQNRIPKTTFNIEAPRGVLDFFLFFTSFVVHCIMFRNPLGGGDPESDNEEKYHTLATFPTVTRKYTFTFTHHIFSLIHRGLFWQCWAVLNSTFFVSESAFPQLQIPQNRFFNLNSQLSCLQNKHQILAFSTTFKGD